MRHVRAMLLAAAFMTGAALPATATPTRSALEGTARYADFARQMNGTLEGVPGVDLRKNHLVSTDFEKLLVKTIFSLKMY